jgi:hypothetical protein
MSTALGRGEASSFRILKVGEEDSISLLNIQNESISGSYENVQECYVETMKTIKKRAWQAIIIDELHILKNAIVSAD